MLISTMYQKIMEVYELWKSTRKQLTEKQNVLCDTK